MWNKRRVEQYGAERVSLYTRNKCSVASRQEKHGGSKSLRALQDTHHTWGFTSSKIQAWGAQCYSWRLAPVSTDKHKHNSSIAYAGTAAWDELIARS